MMTETEQEGRFDLDSRPPSMRVLEAIADRENREPAELEPPLYEAVNPEALDDLFAPTSDEDSSRSGRVSFRYRGYDVTVHASGNVNLA